MIDAVGNLHKRKPPQQRRL